jgi:hypothetical protein
VTPERVILAMIHLVRLHSADVGRLMEREDVVYYLMSLRYPSLVVHFSEELDLDYYLMSLRYPSLVVHFLEELGLYSV